MFLLVWPWHVSIERGFYVGVDEQARHRVVGVLGQWNAVIVEIRTFLLRDINCFLF